MFLGIIKPHKYFVLKIKKVFNGLNELIVLFKVSDFWGGKSSIKTSHPIYRFIISLVLVFIFILVAFF